MSLLLFQGKYVFKTRSDLLVVYRGPAILIRLLSETSKLSILIFLVCKRLFPSSYDIEHLKLILLVLADVGVIFMFDC